MSIQPLNTTSTVQTPPGSPASGQKGEVAASLRQADIAQGPAAASAVAPEKAIRAASEAQATSPEQVKDAVNRIREFVQPINDSIQFSVDDDSGRMLVKVIDQQTKEVLRQIPSEEVLNIAKALDKLQGLLIQNKA